MNTPLTRWALCALAACAAPAGADDATRVALADLRDLPERLALGGQALAFAGRELEGERVVKGAPYCATMVHENVQALADGNRIVRSQSSQICRDGEGRTRREVQREGAPKVVYLNDPVAKESWAIYPDQRRVQRLRAPVRFVPGIDSVADAAWQASMKDWGERMREQATRWKEWGARVAERARSADAERVRARAAGSGGEPGIVIEREIVTPAAGASAPQLRRELRVLRASELPPLPATPPVPPVPPAAAALPMPPLLLQGPLPLNTPRQGGTTTALPTRAIDGLNAHGERTTWTIEAGKIGNEKPIVISREVWRSPELMLTLSSRDSDPRVGEQSYRLEKIRRGEPDAALMKPPAGFSETPRRPAERAASAPQGS